MALLWMDGFESGEYISKYVSGGSLINSATTRFGTGKSAILGALTRSIPASNQIFMGFAFNAVGMDTQTPRLLIYLNGDTGTTIHLTVGFLSTGITLWRGNMATVLGTFAMPVGANVWYSFEMTGTIADTGGICQVKINGNTVINYTGDTKNGGTNTTVDAINLASNGFQVYCDDFYICDGTGSAPYNTFLGDVRVYALLPSAAGSSTQFTPSTGANYTTVDEIPYSATDFVSSSTTGNRDLYALSDLPATVTNVLAVQNNIVAKRTDAAATILKPAIKSGATVYYGADTNLGATDASILDLRTTDPNTSAAWTAGGVNALEAGFELG